MTREEAMAWLTGERSAWNQHYGMGNDTRNAMASCAVEDAARTEQAYWTMRADSEGLIPANAAGEGPIIPECGAACEMLANTKVRV
jgi:hypothetical protein